MKKVSLKKYCDFSNEEKVAILNEILPKKQRYFEFGVLFGICVLAISVVMFICLFAFQQPLISYLWFIPEILTVCGVCSIIGGVRSKKEGLLYEQGFFKIRRGYVAGTKKRNSWSDKVTVRYTDKDEEVFSVIGHTIKRNSKVYVTIADREKAPWVLPRIIKR